MFAKCRHKSKVNDAVKEAFVSPGYSFEYSFEVAMEYEANGETKKTMFLLHHSIECDLMDDTLRAWANSQKYIPWVAVAAQLPASQYSRKCLGILADGYLGTSLRYGKRIVIHSATSAHCDQSASSHPWAFQHIARPGEVIPT